VEYADRLDPYVKLSAKPIFSKLGPKCGPAVKQVVSRIAALSGPELEELARRKTITFDLDGKSITLTDEEIEIVREEPKGYAVESDGSCTIVLDTTLTDELIREGLARELINKIQNKRKDSGFEVTDRIRITLYADGPVAAAVMQFGGYISGETLAEPFLPRPLEGNAQAATEFSAGKVENLTINGEKTYIALERI